MLPVSNEFFTGAAAVGIIFVLSKFFGGFFQHFGIRSSSAIAGWILGMFQTDQKTKFSAEELRERTLELHNELAEFQTRNERERSRDFWNESDESLTSEDMREMQKRRSIQREERKGEFLKKFAPRMEMIFQEYEQREITPDDDMNDFESLRWWAKQGEVSRLLPTLRHLAQKLEMDEQ